MAHIELSLSEVVGPPDPASRAPAPIRAGASTAGSLDRWAAVVAGAAEPCVLIDRDGIVVVASAGCGVLFSIDSTEAAGRPLVDGVLRVLDFNAESGGLPQWEQDKVPPLLAIRSEVLARGLVRVYVGAAAQTVDAISTPLRDGSQVVGSLTFFAPVGR